MAAPTSFQIRLPKDLATEVRRWARQQALTPSAALRDLVRQAMLAPSSVDRGWHEGWTAGHAEYMRQAHSGKPISKRKVAP